MTRVDCNRIGLILPVLFPFCSQLGSVGRRVRSRRGWPTAAAVFPGHHPPFLLPCEGEETEEEREISRLGSGRSIAVSPQSTPLKSFFAAYTPHGLVPGGECEQKPSMEGAKRRTDSGPMSGRHERREVRAMGVTLAGPRPAQVGGKRRGAPCAQRTAVIAEPGSTRSPEWRCA